MSANDDDEVPGREIAYRIFAAEYDDASLSYAESDEERAPNYVITPTGARLNRLFAVGTLTEVTSVNDEMVRARVVDPTGAFVVYAGQYQPDELAFLEQAEPPLVVAVTGKARTFQPEDSDRVYTSIRPESIATVDADTRDRWVVSTAEQTLERIGTYASATTLEATGDALTDALGDADVESSLADGIPLAQEHYGTTPGYLTALRDCALEAVEVVAGERNQVSGLQLRPDETSSEYETATFDSLAERAAITPADHELVEEAQPADSIAATTDDRVGEATTDVEAADSSAEAPTGGDTSADSEFTFEGDTDADLETDTSETADATGGSEPADVADEDGLDDRAAVSAEPDAEQEESIAEADTTAAVDEEDPGDFGGGMYEMDDSEREQLEAEFGTEFTTGSEVEEPGEVELDVPEPDTDREDDREADADAETDAEHDAEADELGAAPVSNVESDSDETSPNGLATDDASLEEEAGDEDAAAESTTDEPTADPESDAGEDADIEGEADTADEPADDVDLQAHVVETMQELDDGNGADRSNLVETVAADTGVTEADVEDAIEDALMGGQCYEPDDETLKAI